MDAQVWSDYLCPWCYVGLDRSDVLRGVGVEVISMPYELHPAIPQAGVSLRERWGSRLAEATAMYARIEAACAEVGLPFRRPEHIPNTRRALETAEFVRLNAPAVFPALERALFTTHFVDGRSIGDPDVVDELVAAAGGDASETRRAVEAGATRAAVDASMSVARDAGVSGTPAWLLDGRLLIPGVQTREHYVRFVERLRVA